MYSVYIVLTKYSLSAARSPVFSAMFEHSMEESIKVCIRARVLAHVPHLTIGKGRQIY